MANLLTINLLVLLGSLVALVGGLIGLWFKPLNKLLTKYATAFAAGVLLTISLLGLIPEAIHELGESAFLWVLGAFVGTYLFESLLFELHHHDDGRKHHHHQPAAVPLVIFGDTIHNFIDGATIAAAYFAHPGLGITLTFSTLLHEMPHEMADFGILLQAGWPRKKIVFINVLSALASFGGAYAVIMTAQTLEILGYLLAISGGIFLYLAAGDFLPKPGRYISHKKAAWAMIAGVLIMIAALTLIPHR
jgi:zinc and cadmium transporter